MLSLKHQQCDVIKYFLFVCLALVPIALVLLGMDFKLYQVVAVFQDTPVIKFLMSHGLSVYVVQALNTSYKPVRNMPYSYIPLVFMIKVEKRSTMR